MDDTVRNIEQPPVRPTTGNKPVESSRLPGFYKLPIEERVAALSRLARLPGTDAEMLLDESAGLPLETANQMIENAIGVFALPLGLGLNFLINGRDYLVPMAVEEPSVVAAVSFAAKIAREGGGFIAECDDSLMIAQVQVTQYGDLEAARQALLDAKEQILAISNSFH